MKQLLLSLIISILMTVTAGISYADTSVSRLSEQNAIPSSTQPTMTHNAYSFGLSPIASSLLFLMGVTSYAIGTLLLLERNLYSLYLHLFKRRQVSRFDTQQVSMIVKKKDQKKESVLERTKGEIAYLDELLRYIQKPVAL